MKFDGTHPLLAVLNANSGMLTEDDLRNQAFMEGPVDSEQSERDRLANRLKEPRDLYSSASLLHIPKWPIECQVLPEKIRHVDKAPAKFEPFYCPTNCENQPKPVGEEMGTVIYDYSPKLSVDYFCRASAGGSSELQIFEKDVNSLWFESRFESGNLAKVIKVTNVYYELYLRPDMYTDRHSQWFYFRIQNTKENVTYRLSIVNLSKPDSLYKYGLKPLMYSEKEAQSGSRGWFRCGQNVSYYKNDITADDNGSLYTLTFTLKFRHNNDTVFLAHCYPYTYTNLQNYLTSLENDENRARLCQQRLLCRSLAGNNIYVLTITSPDNTSVDEGSSAKKPVVVLSARVHPGETQSSYMMKGIIDFLTSSSVQAEELRDRFIFKLIPMLNPDGVIVGNSRCCLLGQDLNRQYRTVLREAFPQIYHTKVMLRRLMDENGIYLYCDLHGHSRRNNVFMYGCENKRVPEKKLIEQVFPLMMHKNGSDKFSFQNCKFKIQKSKEGTGRVFAWTIGVDLSYTLEISLGGSTMPSRQNTHFNTYDYEAAGRHFCETLLDYSDPTKDKMKEKILHKLTEGGSTADEPLNVPITDYSSLSHSETDDTDSAPEEEAENSKPQLLKRSVSFRRQLSLRSSAKSRLPKPKANQKPLKYERSVVHLAKTSVDYVRNRPKRTESAIISATIEEKARADPMTRLSKFRKRSKRVNFTSSSGGVERTAATFITTKCANILFDDPFNPPGQTALKLHGSNEELISVTEDECDDSDGVFKNLKYLRRSSADIAEELALLQLSPFAKKNLTGEQNTVPYPSANRSQISFGIVDYKSTVSKLPTSTLVQETTSGRKQDKKFLKPPATHQRRQSLSYTRLSTLTESKVHSLSASATNLSSGSFSGHKPNSSTTPSVKSLVSQRRVSWTGVTNSGTTPMIALVPVNTTAVSRSSIPQPKTEQKSGLSPRPKPLTKSKSVGDKEETKPSSNQNASVKKRKTKLKRTKSRK